MRMFFYNGIVLEQPQKDMGKCYHMHRR